MLSFFSICIRPIEREKRKRIRTRGEPTHSYTLMLYTWGEREKKKGVNNVAVFEWKYTINNDGCVRAKKSFFFLFVDKFSFAAFCHNIRGMLNTLFNNPQVSKLFFLTVFFMQCLYTYTCIIGKRERYFIPCASSSRDYATPSRLDLLDWKTIFRTVECYILVHEKKNKKKKIPRIYHTGNNE